MRYHEEGLFKTLPVGPRPGLFSAGSRISFEAPYSTSADLIGQWTCQVGRAREVTSLGRKVR